MSAPQIRAPPLAAVRVRQVGIVGQTKNAGVVSPAFFNYINGLRLTLKFVKDPLTHRPVFVVGDQATITQPFQTTQTACHDLFRRFIVCL